MKLLAFGHRRRVGKNQACDYLYSHLRTTGYTHDVGVGSFAYGLKLFCAEHYGLQSPEYYEDNPQGKNEMAPTGGETVRDVWIRVGNEERAKDPDIWINTFKEIYGSHDLVLVSDLRYPNEAEYVKQHGKVCRIDRPGEEKFDDVADSALAAYAAWDEVIVNDGDLRKFSRTVVNLFGEWCSAE